MAAELAIGTVLVPEHAGVLSALGMLMADAVRDYADGVLGVVDGRLGAAAHVEPRFAALESKARAESPDAELRRTADLRYRGQSYELNVPWEGSQTAQQFHREHQRLYGYSHPEREIEVVTLRVRARTVLSHPKLSAAAANARGQSSAKQTRRIWTGDSWRVVPLLRRADVTKKRRSGPALVIDYGATTLIPAGWRFHIDVAGNL